MKSASIITLVERIALEGLRCPNTPLTDEMVFHEVPPEDWGTLDRLVNPKTQPSLVHRRGCPERLYALTPYGAQCIDAFDRNYGRQRFALTTKLYQLEEADRKLAKSIAQLEKERRACAAEKRLVWRDILAMDVDGRGTDDTNDDEDTTKEQG